MRVIVVDPHSYTPPYDHSLAAALSHRGHDVNLLTSAFRFGPTPPIDGFQREERLFTFTDRLFEREPRSPLRLGVQIVEYIPSMRRLLQRVRSLDPDVVHVQWLPFPVLDIAWLRKLACEWPTILTAHDTFPPRARSPLGSWSRALLMVDAIVVHSHRGADALARSGVDDRRLEVVAHPVFPPEVATQTIDRDESIILFFGLIRRRKSLDVLVRALPSIVEAVPAARLVVAGDPMEPMKRVRGLATALGIASRIDWRLGYLPTDEIAEIMGRASIVVLPYSRAGSSGVLATSLGYGRPVVVSDVGSLGETVRDFGAGRVVPPGDSRAVGLACIELLSDREAWECAAAGAKRATRVLTWDAAAAAHERIYASACRARSSMTP